MIVKQRWIFSKEQAAVLEAAFRKETNPGWKLCRQLAAKFNTTSVKINVSLTSANMISIERAFHPCWGCLIYICMS